MSYVRRRNPANPRGIPLAMLLLLLAAPAALAEELTIGLIPEQNVFHQKQRFRPIGHYLEQTTGIRISFTILPRYGNIIESFEAGGMDGAFWGSFTAALAIEKLGVEPIVRPLWLNGTSAYFGYVFVRKDSGIEDVAGMRGKVMAFVEKATTAGYVFPTAYLRANGVADPASYFDEIYFTGSHDASIAAVLDGKADVGCAKNTIFRLVEAADPRVKRDLRILAESPRVPSNGLGLRSDVDPELRDRLAAALLSMEETPAGIEILRAFGAIRFIPTTKADYAPVFEIAEAAGIDLGKYEYVNE